MSDFLQNKTLEQYIEELIACEALELLRCPSRSRSNLYIPYMMNDAVEYYLILHECSATGELAEEFDEKTEWELSKMTDDRGRSRNILVLRRSSGNFTTLAFSDYSISRELYQYHRIGHFWVKDHVLWRRLVYVIGTINDKMLYLGEKACNEIEEELIPLMHFAPFRYWSPIKESIDNYYDELPVGMHTFIKFAREAGDADLVKKIKRYDCRQKLFGILARAGSRRAASKEKTLISNLALEFTKKEHRAMYHLLLKKIEAASVFYAKRDYGNERNAMACGKRQKVTERMLQDGYTGEYPVFRKEGEIVIAYEEHPFVIEELDYKDFYFDIHLINEEGVKKELT